MSSHKVNSSMMPLPYAATSSNTPSLSANIGGNSLLGGSGLVDRSRAVYGSPSSGSAAVASSSSLKEEYEERQKLEKNNFELKMKIYYLEESLKRYQDGEQSNDLQSVNHQIEIEKLKRQIDDKHIDLEQRNLLLMKSKNAIEALKIEVDRLRQDNEHAHDLEDRVRKLNQLNKDVENTYLEKISDMEFQLLSQRKVIENKDKERTTVEERLTNTDLSNQHLENKLRQLQDDKSSLSEQLVLSQHKVSKLEGELTQAITHADLYRIQLEECKNERDGVKEKLKQEQLMKLKIEEEYSERLNAMSKQSDTQLRLLRSVHEDDMEKMRKGHLEMVTDVRDSYHAEMTRLKSEFDRNMNDVKRSDAIDHDRTITSYNSRMDEKNEEIKSLRSMLSNETQRSNTILQELEATRSDLKLKIQHIDNLSVESNMKSDELRVIPRLSTEVDEWKRKYALLHDQYKHENAEKIQINSRLEQTTALLDSNRNTLKETDQSLQSAHHEISRLNKELVDQTSRADTVELISRENERLKNNIAQLETEIISMNHKASELKREIERMSDENMKLCVERESLKESLKGLSNKIDTLQEQIDGYHIQNQSEKERRSASEAALNETRNVVLQSRDEVQTERNLKLALEKKVGMVEDELRDVRKSIGSACVMSYQAMLKWDEMMSGILDGELFVGVGMIPSRNLTGKLGFNRLSSSSSSSAINATLSGSNNRGVNMNVLLNNNTTNNNTAYNNNYHHDNNVDLLDLSHDQLMQRVAISIERVDLKVHRTQKIRSLFLSQTETLITAVQDSIQNTHEKVSLYNHKLTDSQMYLQKIKDTIHKDIKQRDDEMLEIKQFKEVVLTQHSAQLRDSELRYAQLTQQLQHEKQRSSDLQLQVTSQIDELRTLQQTNQKLHDELEVLERTEKIVSELSDRVTDLGETNRSLMKELEVKLANISQLTYDFNEVFSQHDSLQTKYEILVNKIRMKEENLLENERKTDGLVREIERLRARQIHPDLAQTILDTQNILQDAARGGGGGGTALTNTLYDLSPLQQQQQKKREVMFEGDKNSNNVSDIMSSFITHIQQLEDGAGDLIRKSSDMIAKFETHLASTRTTRSNAATNEVKQEIYDLLDANARISVQIQQVIGELKKGMRHISSSIITRNNANGGSNEFHQSTDSKVNSTVDSRQISAIRPYSNNPSTASNNNNNNSYSNTSSSYPNKNHSSDNRYSSQPTSSHAYRSTSSSRNQSAHHYDDSNARDSPGEINIDDLRVDSYKSYSPGLSPADYMTSDVQQTPSIRQSFSPLLLHNKNNKLNVGNNNNNHILSSSLSRHNDNIAAQSSHVTSSDAGSYDLHKNDRSRKTSLSYDLSSKSSSTINNNNINNTKSSTAINSSSSYTPNTATRISTNRLNKLGNDLEALAKKLDTFDTSRSR
jgi:chromosome segregation ATPase